MTRISIVVAGLLILSAVASGESPDAAAPSVRVIRQQTPPDRLAAQRELLRQPPLLRGYRAILDDHAAPWPHEPPDAKSPAEFRAAAAHVAGHLACDGLLQTTARVIELLGPQRFSRTETESAAILRTVGLPTDLLDWFTPPDTDAPRSPVEYIRNRLEQGRSADDLHADLAAFSFRPLPAAQGLRLAPEDGHRPPRLARVQLTRAGYWRGPGDGSAFDIAAQLAAALPQTDLLISTSFDSQSAIADAVKPWSTQARTGRINLLAGPWKPDQWAQDNGKPAILYSANGDPRIVTLAPRYASRGEERTVFDPGETFTLAALSAIGHRVIQSPLLFQGGNLLAVEDPANDSRRTLLVGEAEILRNTALGLSREQVLQSLAVQCSVDRCLVLPAVSFHIDVDLCVRRHRDRIVVFVNDELAAARIILAIGAECLARAGLLDADDAANVRRDLTAASDVDAIRRLAPRVLALSEGGAYSPSVAAHFAHGATDAPTANFERFLLALDLLAAATMGEDLPSDPMTRAYVLAMRRRTADHAALRTLLAKEGWRIVAIPSISDEHRGINYVNGFHVPGRYLMPAYGGIFTALDDAAAGAIRAALHDEVEIVRITCGETQRRLGAIHCAASLYYDEAP